MLFRLVRLVVRHATVVVVVVVSHRTAVVMGVTHGTGEEDSLSVVVVGARVAGESRSLFPDPRLTGPFKFAVEKKKFYHSTR